MGDFSGEKINGPHDGSNDGDDKKSNDSSFLEADEKFDGFQENNLAVL